MRSSTLGADVDVDPSVALAAILPDELVGVVRWAGSLAAEGRPVCVVGGVVRDWVLGTPSEDLDLMVEALRPEAGPGGDPFVRILASLVGARVEVHPRFLTAVLSLPSGARIDVAQARVERYPAPASLPEVAPARFEDDLRRRDFTFNAMALRLAGPRQGRLWDPLGGLGDLERGILRVIHARSFLDDPTRIYRGARFAARLGMAFDAWTASLAEGCFASGIPGDLSAARVGAEVWQLAGEPAFPRALALLEEVGGLGSLGLEPPGSAFAEAVADLWALGEGEHPPGIDPAGLELARGALLALLACQPPNRREAALSRWGIVGSSQRKQLQDVEGMGATHEALAAGAPPSMLVPLLEGLSAEARALCWLYERQGPHCAQLQGALERLGSRPPLDGADLMALGVPRGPRIGALLAEVRRAWLDGEITSRGEAEVLIRGALEEPR